MKIFHYGKDGGKESTVWGWWLVEIKPLFSAALLCFENGSREAFHEHAFNSVSWVLKGGLDEELLGYCSGRHRYYDPSFKPIFTKRDTFHKVSSVGRTWVLTFRGPWKNTWREWLPRERRYQTLTHGRKVVS
jgi:hypothetical protein